VPMKGELIRRHRREAVWAEKEAESKGLRTQAKRDGTAVRAKHLSRRGDVSQPVSMPSPPLSVTTASSAVRQHPVAAPRIRKTKTQDGIAARAKHLSRRGDVSQPGSMLSPPFSVATASSAARRRPVPIPRIRITKTPFGLRPLPEETVQEPISDLQVHSSPIR
jgi:hypothetical protein